MIGDAIPSGGEPVRSGPDDAALIARLAEIDDLLGGCANGVAETAGGTCGETAADAATVGPELATTIDTILLLRQAAAAERGTAGEPLVLPQRIGRYEIVCIAGRGAFAYVLEARDEILHRRIALKIARPEALVSAAFRRRFIREAELAARLIHPHIVPVYEVGEDAGRAFIAGEYCAGGDLAAWLAEHPGAMPARQAAEIVRALATAVAHAHANGIVHRDIKPANVLLVPERAEAGASAARPPAITGMTAKLGDFGLGKLFLDRDDEQLTRLTGTGSRLGTPAWMAPEQIDRSFGEVGPATDVHALGLLLDRLLTGRCVFEGGTEAEIFRGVLLDEAVAADRVNRAVPADLAAVCLACLAKRPADRYASAADLAADLGRFLAGEPTAARPLSAVVRVARAVARRPLFSLLAAVATGGVLIAGWAIRERSRETQRLAAGKEEISRLEAATELRRGFEAWRTGNAGAALDHLRGCAAIDAGVAESLGGRWLLARLHGEHDMLLAPADPSAAKVDLYCFAFSHDGRMVAAGGADGRIFLVQLTAAGGPAGPPLVIAAHDEVNDVAFSPDGRELASAGEDGRLRVWSVADGSLAREAHRARGPLFAAAYSPTGDRLVCGGADQTIRVIPRGGEDGVDVRPFAAAVAEGKVAADAEVEAIRFVSDDEIAVACGSVAAIVALADGRGRMFEGHAGNVGQVAVSGDGRLLLSSGTDREPQIWDIATGELLLKLPRHPGWVQGCEFLAGDRAIVTGCRDGVVRIFDAQKGTQERTFVGHVGRTWDVRCDPSGMIVSAGADGTLRRWDPATSADAPGMRESRLPRDEERPGRSRGGRWSAGIAAPARGEEVAVMKLPRRIVSVSLDNGRITETPSSSDASGYALAIDSRRDRIAVVAEISPIELHALSAVRLHAIDGGEDASAAVGVGAESSFERLPGMEGWLAKDAAWTPSGVLIAGCTHGRLLAWADPFDRCVEVDHVDHTIDAIGLAPAGRARLAIGAGKVLRVYPLLASEIPTAAGARTLVTIGPEAGLIMRVAWSPDGGMLAYGTTLGEVEIIDVDSGAEIARLPRLSHEVIGIVFSPDGRTLVTADAECVRFADVSTAMTLDEVRPGWRVESLDLSVAQGGARKPLLVIGGADVAPGGNVEPRIGVFDLHRTLSPRSPRP